MYYSLSVDKRKRNKSCVAGFFMRERNVMNHAPTAHAITLTNTKMKRLGNQRGLVICRNAP